MPAPPPPTAGAAVASAAGPAEPGAPRAARPASAARTAAAARMVDWIQVTPLGLCLPEAGLVVDPVRPVPQALITHGHADHARRGHGQVWATAPTLALMAERFGADHATTTHALAYGQAVAFGDLQVSFHPAGHVWGSAQIRLECRGTVVVVSGDYKRAPDPTCPPFQPLACDVFVTEATFGLPVFTHPPIAQELGRLLAVRADNPGRALLVGCYALGKCQRLIAELRALGYHRPIFLHGAMVRLTRLFQDHGFDLGEVVPVAADTPRDSLAGEIVLCPPSALNERWSRRLPDPITAMASGWMRVRARARQRLVDLPLVISDHVDWPELTRTLAEVGAGTVWVTHGREEAVVHHARSQGIAAMALHLVGYEEEETG